MHPIFCDEKAKVPLVKSGGDALIDFKCFIENNRKTEFLAWRVSRAAVCPKMGCIRSAGALARKHRHSAAADIHCSKFQMGEDALLPKDMGLDQGLIACDRVSADFGRVNLCRPRSFEIARLRISTRKERQSACPARTLQYSRC